MDKDLDVIRDTIDGICEELNNIIDTIDDIEAEYGKGDDRINNVEDLIARLKIDGLYTEQLGSFIEQYIKFYN